MTEYEHKTNEAGALELMAIAFLAALVIVLAVPVLQGLGDTPDRENPLSETKSHPLDERPTKNFN